MKNKICIIGCGNIGFRHLESFLKNKNKLKIYFFEKNKICIQKILIYLQNNNPHNHKIMISKVFNISKHKFEILIIATNSELRLKIINNFYKKKNIAGKIILEKLVTQNLNDFKKIINIKKEKKINIYVNCSRRMFSSYKKLKEIINNRKIKRITAIGSNWGLASNSIHIIDLFGFLSGKINNFTSTCNIEKILPSKRKGFYDFYGEININIDKSSKIIMIDKKSKKNNFVIEITGEDFKYIVNESNHTITCKDKYYNLDYIKKEFKSEMQSNLSIKYLNKYIKLTKIDESYNYHQILIKTFDLYFKTKFKNKNKYLIT
mgnify:FL=1